MPLLDTIPDTQSYLIAGYVAFAVIFAIYLASFVIRRRNLEEDLKTLETLRAEQPAPASKARPLVKSTAKSKTPAPALKGRGAPKRRVTRRK